MKILLAFIILVVIPLTIIILVYSQLVPIQLVSVLLALWFTAMALPNEWMPWKLKSPHSS